ncbi:MAG TPA: glycosyltransferase family 4 protein [Haliangiales bacterium]|nr:glycosyltransferase family 4 protein [Haliangiales bacterium]
MKILYLCPDLGVPALGRKGASVHVRELVAAFGRAGHNVVLAAPVLNKSPWETPAVVEANLLHVRPSSRIAEVAAALKGLNALLGVENSLPGELRRILYNQEFKDDLKRRFDGDPPDFIYERASLYGTAGVVLARELNAPHLLELNAPLAVEQASYRGRGLGELASEAERWTLSRADAVLTVSAALRDHVVSLGAEAARVHVFPNGVDPSLFQPGPPDASVRARLGLDDGPVLGFVGGLRPWHGIEALPGLIERLARRHRQIRLAVVGDGQLRPQLEESFRKKKMRERVVFAGTLPHEEVAAVVRQFDIALAPYPRLDHAFYFSPLKLFEYMACGVAVVAAAVGQICEVVRDGKTGLLYPPGDVEALAGACDRLLDNPRLRRTLGRAAAKLVHTHYTWDRNASRAVDLARSLRTAERGGKRVPGND